MDILRKLFGSGPVSIPGVVKNSLSSHFPNASGVEWSISNTIFEAVFYHDNTEKIARFDKEGALTEYRVNIFPHAIPSPVNEIASGQWEIMNCIAVYTSDRLSYELIVRDNNLIRYKLLLDSLGNRIGLEKL